MEILSRVPGRGCLQTIGRHRSKLLVDVALQLREQLSRLRPDLFWCGGDERVRCQQLIGLAGICGSNVFLGECDQLAARVGELPAGEQQT